MSINRELIRRSFKKYTDAYDSSDEKIRLKIYHTEKVAEISDLISDAEKLTEEDRNLAWAVGMLHDIGRFQQIKRYGTFKDAISVDHAKLGADILFVEGLIDEFGADSMTEEELLILELAIRQHNRYRISQGLTKRQQLFCNIIRDADKLDIMRVNLDSPMEVIYGVSTEELMNSGITPEVLDGFYQHTCILRSLRKTAVDNLVGHISLAYELVFPVSWKIALDQGHLMQMLDFSSHNPQTKDAFENMKIHLQEYIEAGPDSSS